MIITLSKRKETLNTDLMIDLNNLVTDLNLLIIEEDSIMIPLLLPLPLIHLKDHITIEEIITDNIITKNLIEKKVIIFNGFNHVMEN
tara:strand:- start:4557 stop:4817 length:261 start_codon:yes stop_codon:yes gene_type:complete